MSTSTAVPPTAATPAATLFRTGAVAGLVGGLAAMIVALVALALGVSLEVTQPGAGVAQTPLPAFVIATVVAALAGAALALALQRWTSRPARTFTVTATALTVLSFVQPVFLAQDTATAVTLVLAHLVAAAVVIPALARRLPEQR